MENATPSLDDILGLIAQVEKLKQAEEDFIKKNFLTPTQKEAVDPGRNIPYFLINLYNREQDEFIHNFGLIQKFFPTIETQDRGEFVINWSDGLVSCYDPDLHDPFPIRCDFDEREFRAHLKRHKDREKQVYWNKNIAGLIVQLDRDLTPWLPFIKNYICMDIRQAIIDQTAKTVDDVGVDKLDDVIYELNRIQAVVEKLETQQPALEDLDAGKETDDLTSSTTSGREPKEIIAVTLTEFMKKYCEGSLSPSQLNHYKTSLQKANGRAIELPKHIGEWKRGKPKWFDPEKLKANWSEYRKFNSNLPLLKQSH